MTAAEIIERGKAVLSGEYVARTELAAAQAALKEAQTALSISETKLGEESARVAQLTAACSEANVIHAKLNDQLSAAIKETEDLKARSKTAGEEAARQLASVGQPPVEIQPEKTGPAASQSKLAQFRAEKDPQKRAAFWREHEAAIFSEFLKTK